MAKKENCEQLQEEKSLEEMFAELDLLAEKLENRDTSLEDSFILYRQGMELLKLCSGKLDTVEKKMLQAASASQPFIIFALILLMRIQSSFPLMGRHDKDIIYIELVEILFPVINPVLVLCLRFFNGSFPDVHKILQVI